MKRRRPSTSSSFSAVTKRRRRDEKLDADLQAMKYAALCVEMSRLADLGRIAAEKRGSDAAARVDAAMSRMREDNREAAAILVPQSVGLNTRPDRRRLPTARRHLQRCRRSLAEADAQGDTPTAEALGRLAAASAGYASARQRTAACIVRFNRLKEWEARREEEDQERGGRVRKLLMEMDAIFDDMSSLSMRLLAASGHDGEGEGDDDDDTALERLVAAYEVHLGRIEPLLSAAEEHTTTTT